MTEISLIVTLNNQFNSTVLKRGYYIPYTVLFVQQVHALTRTIIKDFMFCSASFLKHVTTFPFVCPDEFSIRWDNPPFIVSSVLAMQPHAQMVFILDHGSRVLIYGLYWIDWFFIITLNVIVLFVFL